jgi:GDP-L-fucose synthase
MWNGYPQEESSGYSMAKKMGIVAANVYRKQYGLDSTVLIPGNMYGEFDNYRNAESHVIPAMIRRFYEAKLNKTDKLLMWGTGKPERDFVYAGDVARCMLFFLEHPQSSPINLSSGTTTSIRELSSLVAEIVGYSGKIEWDETKPDGQMVKIFDTKRMKSLGLNCHTPLNVGIRKAYEWFTKNYQNRSDGIRL